MNPLTIVIIIVIIVLIIMLLKYLMTNPYTLQGLTNGETMTKIESSTLATNGSGIPSTNFAYSIWFYVNDWNYRYGEPKVIFGRMAASSSGVSNAVSNSSYSNTSGNSNSFSGTNGTTSGSNFSGTSGATTGGNSSIPGVGGLDPCPAVVLGAIENDITVSLGCYPGASQEPTTPGSHTIVHSCRVENIPIQKWVNYVISVYGRTLDVYIDGKLVKTCLLPGVANVNTKSPIFVTPKGGFAGWTSKFQYYPNSLSPQQVWNIYSQGYKNIFSSGSYQLQVSLIENGATQGSVTI